MLIRKIKKLMNLQLETYLKIMKERSQNKLKKDNKET